MGTDVEKSVKIVGEAWRESAYYDDAEEWTFIFWDHGHGFREYFDLLDLSSVVELACGHGRHSERAATLAGHLSVMDIHEENLEVCRERLKKLPNVSVLKNNGYNYRPLQDASTTSIFCYDAMVHFSPDIVASYLLDTNRILVAGGMALFHHSNHDTGSSQHYGLNPHARNAMSLARFSEHANAAGLAVVKSTPMDWGGVAGLDGLTLLRKP
jgi:ubiquinone/menaquinone biosynthesis C-methylase UbiE